MFPKLPDSRSVEWSDCSDAVLGAPDARLAPCVVRISELSWREQSANCQRVRGRRHVATGGGEGTHLQAANHVRLDNYWGTGRTEAFSDGVFAIAITLLILEISVPETAFDNLWRGIAEQWPSYLAYATSFITIGGIWLAHHGIFRRLQYANTSLMLINLLLLMAVSFLPFPTKLLAEAIHNSDAERAAVIFYGGSLLVISCLISALWGSVARDRHLLRPEVSAEEFNAIALATTPSVGFYLGVIVLALLAPRIAAFGYLVIAIVAVLRARGDMTQPPSTT